jgi:uncharacterized protein
MMTTPALEAAGGPAPFDSAGRITAIDALRGFAVLGILVMNIQWMSMIEMAATNPTVYFEFEGANRWIWVLSHVLVDQKFMTIFSLLFGAGLILMTSRVEQHGWPSKKHHYRRMVVLLVIGLLHAYFMWYGDILVAYALCGMLAFPMRHKSARTLLLVGAISVAIPSVLMLLFAWSMPYWPAEEASRIVAEWSPSPDRIAEDAAAYRSGYVDVFRYRAPTALEFQTLGFAFWGLWRAGGLILMGMGLLKLRVLSGERSTRFYTTLAGVGFVVGVPIVIYGLYRNIAADWAPEYSFFLGSQYNYWASLVVATGWVGLMMVLCKTRRLAFVSARLAAVGRMALTNYLMQSAICTTIFYGYGFGWYGQVERTGQIAIVLGVWALQLIASPLWLRHFRFGPVEWAWRSLTYGRLQPLRQSCEHRRPVLS